jgi:hypothetical protein
MTEIQLPAPTEGGPEVSNLLLLHHAIINITDHANQYAGSVLERAKPVQGITRYKWQEQTEEGITRSYKCEFKRGHEGIPVPQKLSITARAPYDIDDPFRIDRQGKEFKAELVWDPLHGALDRIEVKYRHLGALDTRFRLRIPDLIEEARPNRAQVEFSNLIGAKPPHLVMRRDIDKDERPDGVERFEVVYDAVGNTFDTQRFYMMTGMLLKRPRDIEPISQTVFLEILKSTVDILPEVSK